MDDQTAAIIRTQVRDGDYDRYLCVQFAPPQARPAMLAILAFVLELGQVHRRTTREPMMGALRFAWWREGLDALYGGGRVPGHPVLEGLAGAVRAYALPRTALEALVNAAEDATQGLAHDHRGLRAAAAIEGAGPLLLWLPILGVERGGDTEAAVTCAGTAWNLTLHALARDDCEAVMRDVSDEISAGRARRRAVAKAAMPALLPLTLAARSLRVLRQGRDPAGDCRVARQLTLLGSALLGRY